MGTAKNGAKHLKEVETSYNVISSSAELYCDDHILYGQAIGFLFDEFMGTAETSKALFLPKCIVAIGYTAKHSVRYWPGG